VAGGVFVAVGDHSGSAHPSAHLSVPKSFGTRVLNEERSAQGAAQLRTQLNGYPVLKAAYAHAVIGLYDQPNSPAGAVFFVGLDGHDIAPPSVLSSADARERFLDEYMDSDVVTDIDDFDPGPMGGSLRCGTVRGKLAECGWLDENTAGFAEINSTSSLDGAAQTTLELRAAAEH
jgi:hypothetical protein